MIFAVHPYYGCVALQATLMGEEGQELGPVGMDVNEPAHNLPAFLSGKAVQGLEPNVSTWPTEISTFRLLIGDSPLVVRTPRRAGALTRR